MKLSSKRSLAALLLLMMALAAIDFSYAKVRGETSTPKKKILIVLSAASAWTRADGSKYPSGYWTEEFVDVHEKFVAGGYQVDIATPGGKKPTADPHSLDAKFAGTRVDEFKKYLQSISDQLAKPLALAKINMADYEAVVIPGGHGPVEDLYKDKDMGRELFDAEKDNKIIGAVCHGQAALLSAVDQKGNWLFKDVTLTSFSDEEEIEFGTASNAPWLLASRLRQCGANYKRGEKNWGAYVVRDGNIISGQNPASSIPMAESIIAALSKKKVCIVLSAASEWTRADGSKYPSGYWTEEFVDVHEKFVAAGFEVHIATPGGKKPTADPHSLDPKFAGKRVDEFKQYLQDLSGQLSKPLVLGKINMADYEAVVIPGGHGPVEDLYKDKDMGLVLFAAEKQNKIIGTVCHGQAALLSAVDEKGNWLFKGTTLTSFSDEEEIEFGTASNAPWLLASRLRQCGANYKRGEKNWSAFVVTDGNVISGQNPASSIPMAEAIIAELNKHMLQ